MRRDLDQGTAQVVVMGVRRSTWLQAATGWRLYGKPRSMYGGTSRAATSEQWSQARTEWEQCVARQVATHHLLATMRCSSSRSVAAGGWLRSGACISASAKCQSKAAQKRRRPCGNLKATATRQLAGCGRQTAASKGLVLGEAQGQTLGGPSTETNSPRPKPRGPRSSLLRCNTSSISPFPQ